MEINKENVFEMIFDGFQQKFIESFKALGEEKILVRMLENQKASKEEFRTYFNCAWEFLENSKIAEQQAKVEELQNHATEIHKREIKLFEKTLILTHEREELQKQVEAVKKLIQGYLDEEKELELKEWEQSTIYGRIAIELEQALKGEVK